MIDDGPIPPLLRQINDALTHIKPDAVSQGNGTDGCGKKEVSDLLGLLRSMVMLWGAQNAMLRGDAPVARDWMTSRLDAISGELDGILVRLNKLGAGGHKQDMRVLSDSTGADKTGANEDANFELIDFMHHLHAQQGK